MIVENENCIQYFKDGKLHREDGPALINKNGASFWYEDGKIHRLDGPAVDWHDGDFTWYKNGLYHRENGPAIDWKDQRAWYLNGVRIDNGSYLKLLLKYKYNLKYKTNVVIYSEDEEERRRLARLT